MTNLKFVYIFFDWAIQIAAKYDGILTMVKCFFQEFVYSLYNNDRFK